MYDAERMQCKTTINKVEIIITYIGPTDNIRDKYVFFLPLSPHTCIYITNQYKIKDINNINSSSILIITIFWHDRIHAIHSRAKIGYYYFFFSFYFIQGITYLIEQTKHTVEYTVTEDLKHTWSGILCFNILMFSWDHLI